VGHVIFCNGYSLAEDPGVGPVKKRNLELKSTSYGDWNKVCIGDGAGLGRIGRTLQLARLFPADVVIIWSTGATWINWASEAIMSFNTALSMMPYPEHDWLRNISILEEKSTNTFTSLENAREIIRHAEWGQDLMMLHLVSSANNMPRVMRDACKIFGNVHNIILSGVPAETSYGGKTPADVVIYELGEPPVV